MSSPNKVYQLGNDDFLDKSHKKLINQLSVLDWEMQVQQIIKSLSLPLSESLLDKDVSPAPNSHASKCGHATIESFITADSSKLGLGMDWGQWASNVTAYNYKKTYSIYTDDPVEIIQEFKDITSFLGYKPSNSEEYQETKDKIFKSQRLQQEKMHSLQVQEMQENINGLIRQATANTELLEQANAKVAELNDQLASAQKEYDTQIEIAYNNHKIELADQLKAQKLEITSTFESKITEIQNEASLEQAKSAQRMEDLKNKYNSDNFVSRAEFSALEQELDRERKNSRNDLIKLNELNSSLELLQTQLSEKEQIILTLEGKINSQAQEILSLSTKIEKGEIAGTELTLEDYENLQIELNKLEAIAIDFKEQNASLQAKEKSLTKSLKIARSNMSKLQKTLKKQKKRNNKQLGIIKGKQLVIATLTALVIVLMTGLSLSIL